MKDTCAQQCSMNLLGKDDLCRTFGIKVTSYYVYRDSKRLPPPDHEVTAGGRKIPLWHLETVKAFMEANPKVGSRVSRQMKTGRRATDKEPRRPSAGRNAA
jgi:hypothetical protein